MNAPIINIHTSEAILQNQPPVTMYLNLQSGGYSGLMGLFKNIQLLAFSKNGGMLTHEAASYLQSCVEATAVTLGDTLTALNLTALNLTALNSTCTQHPNSRENITPLAEFGATVGELLPFLVELASGLASDKTPPNVIGGVA